MSALPVDPTDPLALPPRVSVTPAGQQPGVAFGLAQDVPAPPRSALAGLRERVKAARAQRHKDFRVPGLGDPDDPWHPDALFLRFVGLSATDQAAVMEPTGLTGWAEEWADAVKLITRACVGIFSVDAKGQPIGDPATWPRFTYELAETLGVDLTASTDRFGDLLRQVFVADQDVVYMSNAATQWMLTTSKPVERQSPEA